MMRRFPGVLVTLILLACMSGPVKVMADPVYSDGMVRAAVIFGILRFTDWPETPHSREQVLLCALGESPSERAISSLEKLPSIGASQLRYISGSEAYLRMHDCQAVILGQHAPAFPLAESVLLICDECASESQNSAAVSLARRGDRIQFEVNLDRVREQGISLSASLLELASRCVSSDQRVRGCND